MSADTIEHLQARSRRSAEQILRAAVQVITRQGIHDFTMSAVSDAAGISIGGVYGRYPNKEALLRAVKDEVLTGLETDVQRQLDAADPGSRALLGAFTHVVSNAFAESSGLYAFIFIHSAQDAAMKARGFAFHQRVKGLLQERLLDHGVTDQTGVDVAYDMIMQSLLMRVISMGNVPDGEVPYAGFPDPDLYAREIVLAVDAYVAQRSRPA
ncbi:TetR/AcrR family transcriptional regulator [Aeromicrobium endophyticum]|nr:TetR/AcrR family transcriptional regulator [Aeromicrobium endophyticum]